MSGRSDSRRIRAGSEWLADARRRSLAFFFVRVGVFMTITMKNIRHLSRPPSQHTLQPSIFWPQGTGWRRRRNLVSIGTVLTFMPQRVGNVNAATVDLLCPNE